MLKKLALAALAVFGLSAAAVAGYWAPNWPAFNTAANTTCASYGNNGVCNQYTPAGTTFLTGAEAFPVDTNYGYQPFQQTVSLNYFGNEFGVNQVSTTTGTTAAIQAADATANFIYAGSGAATYTSFVLPVHPIANQKFCIINSSGSTLTLTAVTAPTGYTIDGTFANPASLTTGLKACWSIVGSGVKWYRTT